MGNWMTFQRMRSRNGLMFRKPDDDPDPYFRDQTFHESTTRATLIGDLNRMERDYLRPIYPEHPFATRSPGSDPLSQTAEATGVSRDDVLKVLTYVFLEQP